MSVEVWGISALWLFTTALTQTASSPYTVCVCVCVEVALIFICSTNFKVLHGVLFFIVLRQYERQESAQES